MKETVWRFAFRPARERFLQNVVCLNFLQIRTSRQKTNACSLTKLLHSSSLQSHSTMRLNNEAGVIQEI